MPFHLPVLPGRNKGLPLLFFFCDNIPNGILRDLAFDRPSLLVEEDSPGKGLTSETWLRPSTRIRACLKHSFAQKLIGQAPFLRKMSLYHLE